MSDDNKIVVELSIVDKMSSEISAVRANVESNLEKQNTALRNSKSEVKSLGDELKGNFVNAIKGAVVAYAGMQGIQLITNFMKDARAEYKQSVEAHNKLRAAIGFTSDELNHQADILGKKLIIDNDEITMVQAMIGNYVKNEQQIKKLTPAVLDLASATGIDMATAANMVAKAINDDNGELGRFKIAVEGAKGSSDRIASVISGINKQFLDQAEAVSGARDAWDSLGLKINDVKESAGGWFTGMANELYIQIKSMKDALTGKGIMQSLDEITALRKKWGMETFEKEKKFVGPPEPPPKPKKT